ncbi:MAG TPA: DinB family protein [Longimicrobiales bacterium]|nr:DinB family protein [Longimicrobiales bacterium]
MSTEAWLEGPLEGYPPLLMPVAHSLVQAKRDLRAAAGGLPEAKLWQRPGGAASIGFHLVHAAGSADRLLTYALGNALTPEQLEALAAERHAEESGASAASLIERVDAVLDRVLDTLRRTNENELTAVRYVGRGRVPSTLIGLLFHIAEHTQRHTGQVVTTAKVVRGSGV